MKTMLLFAVLSCGFIATFASFASSTKNSRELDTERIKTSVNVTGRGACRHAGCRCGWYTSAGTGGKCVCGHWDYVHN